MKVLHLTYPLSLATLTSSSLKVLLVSFTKVHTGKVWDRIPSQAGQGPNQCTCQPLSGDGSSHTEQNLFTESVVYTLYIKRHECLLARGTVDLEDFFSIHLMRSARGQRKTISSLEIFIGSGSLPPFSPSLTLKTRQSKSSIQLCSRNQSSNQRIWLFHICFIPEPLMEVD